MVTWRSSAVVFVAFCLVGCLERTETITVEPDGTVLIEAVFKTDQEGELYEGDAIPSDAGGWLVDLEEVEEKGRRRFHLTAEGVFGPQTELPANYAVPGDPDTSLYLQFPTTVEIEDRADGTYYHFHRTYPARAWAHIEALREVLLDEPMKKLKDKDQEDFTPADWKLIARSYTDFEAEKLLTFARSAYLQTTPDAPQDAWLEVLGAFRKLQGALDLDAIAEVMQIDDEDQRQEAIALAVKDWEEKSFKSLETSLRDFCGYAGSRMKDFMRRYESRLKAYDITNGLGDDAFTITVVMPGEIVGCNTDDASSDRATWKFSGRRFRDRRVELMVTSRASYVDP